MWFPQLVHLLPISAGCSDGQVNTPSSMGFWASMGFCAAMGFCVGITAPYRDRLT
jgi:hypothetical protein